MTALPFSKDSVMYTITHQTPIQVYHYIHPTDIYEAISSPWPQLEVLQPDTAISYLAVAIAQQGSLITSPMKITGNEVRRAAVLLLEDYRFFNLSDIILCLNMGIKGELSPSYGRYDVQTLCNWFGDYTQLRQQALRLTEARAEP